MQLGAWFFVSYLRSSCNESPYSIFHIVYLCTVILYARIFSFFCISCNVHYTRLLSKQYLHYIFAISKSGCWAALVRIYTQRWFFEVLTSTCFYIKFGEIVFITFEFLQLKSQKYLEKYKHSRIEVALQFLDIIQN